jgi:hypothetical protein
MTGKIHLHETSLHCGLFTENTAKNKLLTFGFEAAHALHQEYFFSVLEQIRVGFTHESPHTFVNIRGSIMIEIEPTIKSSAVKRLHQRTSWMERLLLGGLSSLP